MVDWTTARPFVKFDFSSTNVANAGEIAELLSNSLISLSVEGTVRGVGTFEAEFYDPTMVLLEHYLFDEILEKHYEKIRLSPDTAPKFQFGWITSDGNIEGSDWIPFLPQVYIPRINEGGLRINVKGVLSSGPNTIFSKPLVRQYYRGSRDVSWIVRDVLERAGYNKNKMLVAPIGVVVEDKVQETNETYMDFIRNKLLFNSRGGTQVKCYVDYKGYFHFHPVNVSLGECEGKTIKMVFPRTLEDVLSYNLSANKGIPAYMGSEQIEVCGFNASTGVPLFSRIEAGESTIKASVATPYHLQSEVEGFCGERWCKARLATMSAEIEIMGNPNIWQGAQIEMFTPIATAHETFPVKHPYFSRTWFTTRVKHNISTSNFTTTLDVVEPSPTKLTTEEGAEISLSESLYSSSATGSQTAY